MLLVDNESSIVMSDNESQSPFCDRTSADPAADDVLGSVDGNRTLKICESET